ncbi:MAG TPA: hypothetical protein VF756_23990 [Thermoanaerobaculia bacterium]
MSTVELLVLLALILGLTVTAAVLGRWRPRRRAPSREPLPPLSVTAPPAAETRDEEAELRRTVDGSEELLALYARLGDLPQVERECERLLAGLKGLIRAEIPDFAAFEAALAQLEKEQDGFRSENEELLREILAARGDRAAVLRLLNRDPVGQLLPFVEQIPIVRNGEVVWRTPQELALVRKRPVDPKRFEALLDDLDRVVRTSPLRRKPAARDAVLAAIVRVRRDARRENAYMPTPLRALEDEMDVWLHRSQDPAAQRRRKELDDLLLGLLRLRRHARRQGSMEDLRETARAQAQLYAGFPWMHTPWLTTCALTNLLDAELALLPEKEKANPATPAGALQRVREEVASRHYDAEETMRRLRQQEERGLYVHSLVYALLRMNRLPESGTGARAAAAGPSPPGPLSRYRERGDASEGRMQTGSTAPREGM